MAEERRLPTRAQLEYLRELISATRTDPEWCEPEKMSRGQVAHLIEKLSEDKMAAAVARKNLERTEMASWSMERKCWELEELMEG